MRSPLLKCNNPQRSPIMSPRKTNSNLSTTNCSLHHQTNIKNTGSQLLHASIQDQSKSRQLITNSRHVSLPEECPAGGSSDEDSCNINVDKLQTIRNKAAQR